MLQIALCDDDASQRGTLRRLLEEYLQQRNLTAKIKEFSNGQTLLHAASDPSQFDLYLLDVVMPDMNGIELGLQLRQRDSSGIILYLTSSPDYAVDSYRTRAFYYLLKPVEPDRFFEVMDQASAQLIRQNADVIHVKTKHSTIRLSIDQIVYAELSNRCIRYNLVDGSYVDSLSLTIPFRSALAPLLDTGRFFPAGASFVLNLHHIKALGKNCATMSGGRELALPRAAYPTLRAAWVAYWLEGE